MKRRMSVLCIKNKSHIKQKHYWEKRCMMYRDRWKDAALREHQRANGRHMSVREGFAMALHRTICKIAARSTGLANKPDMHRSTVCDWEVKLRAALVEHTHFFTERHPKWLNTAVLLRSWMGRPQLQ